MTVLRTGCHRFISLIDFLVTWFGAFPTNHGITLRREEGGGVGRKVETCGLTHDANGTRFACAIHFVAESDVVVRHLESDCKRNVPRIFQIDFQHVGIVSDKAEFRAVHLILLVGFAFLGIDKAQTIGEITDVGLESERRGIQHFLSIVIY